MSLSKYQLIFSLYSHPILGVLLEPYVVKLLDNGNLSLTAQKVSLANVAEFFPQLALHEKKLIEHLEKFNNTELAKIINVGPKQFDAALLKISQANDIKNKTLFEHLKRKLSDFKSLFFNGLNGSEWVFETSKDGYPAGTKILYRPEVKVRMSYRFLGETLQIRPQFSDDGLNGLPTTVLDENTAVILVGQNLVKLPKVLRPNRFKPFANKSVVEVQRRYFNEYAQKFLLHDLEAKLADIEGEVKLNEIPFYYADVYFHFTFEGMQIGLFEKNEKVELKLPSRLSIQLKYQYGDWSPKDEKIPAHFTYIDTDCPEFQVYKRDLELEKSLKAKLESDWLVYFSSSEIQVSFVQLRDDILPKLDLGDSRFQFRFSPEFRQINMKPSKLNIKVLAKIDYFQIEGSIDWDGHSMDILKLKNDFEIENGWLKKDGQYWIMDEEDQAFLQQVFLLSNQKNEISIPIKTVKAIQLEKANAFASHWEKMTTLLSDYNKEKEVEDIASFCPNFTLRDYQVKGVEWIISLYNNSLGGILADDMGLGKTFQTSAFLLYLLRNRNDKKPILVVMPSTLLFNWEHELRRFSPEFKILVHSGPGRSRTLNHLFEVINVVVVSYQTLARDLALFEKESFLTLIVDEAHNLKNPGTVTYKAIQKIKAETTYLLTGTPMQNSPADLWALSELCNPGLLSQKIKPQSVQRVENQVRFVENLNLMQNLVRPFLLRRTKENVLSELPEKTVSIVYCGMEEEQELEYLAQNQLIASEINDVSYLNPTARSVKILKALTKLRLLANHPALIGYEENTSSGKFTLVTEKLKEVLEEGHKILVFSSFVKHLQLFARHLESEKIGFSFLSGQTKDRKKQVEQFQEETDRNVFLISLKAGGTGLNLVEASYVFLLDPWWNPAAENQAMDRVYRIGQKNPVTVYKFITSNTVEEKILQLQERKQGLADQLFESKEIEAPALTLDVLQEILLTKIG
jgi:SNF2 family DNA or RNA helicase